MSEHVSCKECADFLDDYLAGTIDPAEKERFDVHLSRCPPCRDFLESYRETIRLGRACCCRGSLPPKIPEDLVKAILRAKSDRKDGESS